MSVCFPGPAARVRAGCGELQADQGRPGPAASDCGEVRAVGGEEWSLQQRGPRGQAEQRTEHRGAVPSFNGIQLLNAKIHISDVSVTFISPQEVTIFI